MEIHDRDRAGLQHAIEQARIGRSEGGVPIGGALVADDGTVLAVGHNRRVQQNSAIRHGETDALENGGRLPASVYRRSTMYTTLSPCDMCTGAILLYGIPRVVMGENRDVRRRRGLPARPRRGGHQPRLVRVRRADERVHRRPSGDLERGHRRGLSARSVVRRTSPAACVGSRALRSARRTSYWQRSHQGFCPLNIRGTSDNALDPTLRTWRRTPGADDHPRRVRPGPGGSGIAQPITNRGSIAER